MSIIGPMPRRMPAAFGCLLATLAAAPLAAQGPIVVPASESDRYLRLLELAGYGGGPIMYFASGTPRRAAAREHWWAERWADGKSAATLRAVAAELQLAYNSAFPYGTNDGALWAGRGFSASLTGGAVVRAGPLTITAAPLAVLAENRAFALAPLAYSAARSPFAYPWSSQIDWPQRFGDAARAALDPGQSGVRLDLGAFTVGATTENLWWGPAQFNPILMSTTAAGFPHADLGTNRPVSTPIGTVEARTLWGALGESGYFDSVAGNDRRFITGLTLGWAPKWIPGLSLGFARVYYQYWDSTTLADLFVFFQPFTKDALATPDDPEGGDDRDQMLSLTARWLFPEARFEVYGEFARNDHQRNWRDVILEPDHSRAWMLGFAQAIPSGGGVVRLAGEWTHLGRSPTWQVRANPTFYQHHFVRQGYTNRGQLLGAGIGPGSDAQVLAIDRYDSAGRWGVTFQRVRYNDDEYYRRFAATRRRLGHNVALSAGLSAYRFVGPLEVGAALTLVRELNRYYEVNSDATNVNASLNVRWRP